MSAPTSPAPHAAALAAVYAILRQAAARAHPTPAPTPPAERPS
jgi:hypothetical protein